MTTKSERFTLDAQRSAKAPKPKKEQRPRRSADVDTSLPGVSATDRIVGAHATAERNASLRVAKKGGAALEDSTNGKASRKSTRKSAGRAEPASTLKLRAEVVVSSPKARATQSGSRHEAVSKPLKPVRRS